jgi:hypothetical protein
MNPTDYIPFALLGMIFGAAGGAVIMRAMTPVRYIRMPPEPAATANDCIPEDEVVGLLENIQDKLTDITVMSDAERCNRAADDLEASIETWKITRGLS